MNKAKLILFTVSLMCMYTHVSMHAAAMPVSDIETVRTEVLNYIDAQLPTIIYNLKQFETTAQAAFVQMTNDNLTKIRTTIQKATDDTVILKEQERFNKIVNGIKDRLRKQGLLYIEESKPSASQPIQLIGYLAIGAGIFEDPIVGYKRFNQLLPNCIITLANQCQAPLEIRHRELFLTGATVQDFQEAINRNIAERTYAGRNPVTDIQPVVSDADLTFESQGNTFTQTFRLVGNPDKENIWTVINNSDAAPHSYDFERALIFDNPEENRLIIGSSYVGGTPINQLAFLLPMIGTILQGTTPEQQTIFMHRFLYMPVTYTVQDEIGLDIATLEQMRPLHNFIVNIPLYEDTNQQMTALITAFNAIPDAAQANKIKTELIIRPFEAITGRLKDLFERYYEQIRGTNAGMAEKLELIRSRIGELK